MNKKTIFLIFALIMIAKPCLASRFRFYYIAHSAQTPIPMLLGQLNKYYNDIRSIANPDDVSVFYLANESEPFVVIAKGTNDSEQAFETLKGELNSKQFHNIDVDYDVRNIMDMFSRQYPIISVDGTWLYDDIQWTFYVNSEFWLMGCGQQLIAGLYWSMNIHKLPLSAFSLDILCYEDDAIKTDPEKIFGDLNPNGLNKYHILPM